MNTKREIVPAPKPIDTVAARAMTIPAPPPAHGKNLPKGGLGMWQPVPRGTLDYLEAL